MAMLEVLQVGKVFSEGQERLKVLDEASLCLHPGELVALEGCSGSGKTTLLSIIGCILTPSAGQVRLAGRVINPAPARVLADVRRRSIGFVFQQFNLFPALTARENVQLSLELKGMRGASARQQADRLLERVGILHKASALPRDLSGGQKQRVAIARALAGNPQLLLADEPTANLDSVSAAQILDLFVGLARTDGCALLIVTHDPRVSRICDRVLHISNGRIVTPKQELSA